MQKRDISILLFCMALCVITGVIVFKLSNTRSDKIAVVDAIKLFDGYNMKKELEEIEKTRLQRESRELDSINKVFQIERATIKNEEQTKKLENQYGFLKSKLEQDYNQSNHDINEKVWKRLNPLLDEYGKKKGLHLIIGANGMGSVLYNDDYYDQTNEAILFVNKKYAEGN